MTRLRVLPYLLAGVMMLGGGAWGQDSVLARSRFGFLSQGNEPIYITADRQGTYDNRARLVRFIGNVVVVQGTAVLNADELEILLGDDEDGEQIRRIVARGNVRIVQEDRRAVCREATYLGEEGTVTLTGEPQVWQGPNHLRGERIEFYLDTDRIRVFGGEQERVHVTLFPDESTLTQQSENPGNGEAGSQTPDENL